MRHEQSKGDGPVTKGHHGGTFQTPASEKELVEQILEVFKSLPLRPLLHSRMPLVMQVRFS